MPADKISCEKLSGTAKYLCEVETGAMKDDSVDKMWACVQEKEKDADQKARVGYYSDSFGRNKFVAAGKTTALQEKLNFAYADPKYYKCLNDNNFSVPFAMDDFDPKTSADASEKKKVDALVDGIVLELDKESEKFPKDSPEYKKELAQRIFDRSKAAYKFYNDCKVESPDYNALRYDCGMCSESSAVMYYQLKRAGLAPEFLFVHDIKPSLEWFNYMENIQGAMDHVLVGTKPKAGENLQIDLINRLFPADFNFAREISERMFASAWLMNKAGSYMENGNLEKMGAEFLNSVRVAPDNVMPYMMLILMYGITDNTDNAKFMFEHLIRRIGDDHPWTPILNKFVASFAEDYSETDTQQAENMQTLKVMSEKDPYMTGLFGQIMGNLMMMAGMMYMAQAMQGGERQMTPEERQYGVDKINTGLAFLTESFNVDPNSMSVFKYLEVAAQAVGGDIAAMKMAKTFLAKRPDHSPLRAAFVKHALVVAQAKVLKPDAQSELVKEIAIEAKRLLKDEPTHPLSHALVAGAHFLNGNKTASVNELLAAKAVYKERGEKMSSIGYGLLIMIQSMSGDVKAAKGTLKSAIADHGPDVQVEIAEGLYNNTSWYFEAPNGSVVDDEVLDVFPESEEFLAFKKGVFEMAKELKKDEAATEFTDKIFAEAVPYIAIMESAQKAAEWADQIEKVDSELLQNVLASRFTKIARAIAGSPQGIPLKNLKEMEAFLPKAKDLVCDKMAGVIVVMRAGLMWQYLLHNDKVSAGRMLNSLPEESAKPALLQSAQVLLGAGGGTKKNAERLYIVLQLVMENRKKMVGGRETGFVVNLLDEFVGLAEKNGMSTEATTAKGWIDEFGK